MGTLLFSPSSFSSSSAYHSLKAHTLFLRRNGSRSFSDFPNLCSSFCTLNPPTGFPRKSAILAAKKTNKEDGHRSVPKPDESTGFFPEAVLLKEVEFHTTLSSFFFLFLFNLYIMFVCLHPSSYVHCLEISAILCSLNYFQPIST